MKGRTARRILLPEKMDHSHTEREEEATPPEEEPPGLTCHAQEDIGKDPEPRPNLRLVFNRKENGDSWRYLLGQSITRATDLPLKLPVDPVAIQKVISRYPMRINPYYFGLIKEPHDPMWLQAVPDLRELQDEDGLEDSLNEEGQSPVFNLTHRYPDRVLFSGIQPVCHVLPILHQETKGRKILRSQ